MSDGTQAIPPGWYQAPEAPGGPLRWWDGARWTEHVMPQPGAPLTGGPPGVPPGGGVGPDGPGTWSSVPDPRRYPPMGAGAHPSAWARNQFSFMAAILAAVYVVLAASSHFVLLGIAPALFSVRATARREPFFLLGWAATAVAVVVALTALRHA